MGDTFYNIMAGSRQRSLAKPLSLLFLNPRMTLSSHQHRTLVCLFWSGNLDCTVLTHQRIQLLLAKSAFSCCMYPTVQIALSSTASHDWVPPEWPSCQQAQWGRWFTMKHSKVKQASRPKVILKTLICLDYKARNKPKLEASDAWNSTISRPLWTALFSYKTCRLSPHGNRTLIKWSP